MTSFNAKLNTSDTTPITGAPDLTSTGGHSGPQVGFGPNTRTVMRIQVAATTPAPAFDIAKLNQAFVTTGTTDGVFKVSQPPVIMPVTMRPMRRPSPGTVSPTCPPPRWHTTVRCSQPPRQWK